MPELPEVETIVRELRPHLVGRRLVALRVGPKSLRRPWQKEWEPALLGRSIEKVWRRGKWIVLGLSGDAHLVIHLGMTGQLTVTDASTPLEDHTHLVFDLKETDNKISARAKGKRVARQLRFRDIRRFGSATLCNSIGELANFLCSAALGPEPFDLVARDWREKLAKTRRCLKAVLLDQQVVVGVGNIYADETLFEAKLHPGLLANSLSPAAADRLRRAIVTVLERAIEKRGSSIRNYVGGEGLRGSYQQEFRVYGQTGKPCVRCRTAIQCIRRAGRSTHFCPRCQPLSAIGRRRSAVGQKPIADSR